MLDADRALKGGAPLSRPEWLPEGNALPLFFQPSPVFDFGDVNKGFEEADRIIEFTARRRYHGCADAEMLNGITKWEDDCAELWLHHQHPYEHKWNMMKWFGTPMSKVKINSPYNGAMFGGWNWIGYSMIPQYISALLARRINRPVKWVFNRRDDFCFGSMDVMTTNFRVGVKGDGTITAVRMKTFFENLSFESALHLLENTRIPNIHSETVVAQVNKGPVMAFRCEQLPCSFCLTLLFSHVSAELSMDPTEVALKNDGVEGKDLEYLAAFKRKRGFPVRDSLRECIEKERGQWDGTRSGMLPVEGGFSTARCMDSDLPGIMNGMITGGPASRD